MKTSCQLLIGQLATSRRKHVVHLFQLVNTISVYFLHGIVYALFKMKVSIQANMSCYSALTTPIFLTDISYAGY